MISSLELARRCKISQGTVDRALHGRAGISPKTRDRVLRMARQLGYRPNPAARELITGQSCVVGAIIPALNSVFFADLFHELGQALAAQKLRLQISPVHDRAEFLDVLEDFAARRYRMAVVVPPEDNIPVPGAVTSRLSLVSLISPCRGKGIHFITADEEKTGREAVRYLHDKGHQRILHLTYDRKAYAIAARCRGYKEEARKLGLKPRILTEMTQEALTSVIKKEGITAIFCHNDWLALMALLSLSKCGIRVPEDVSVLGVDNSPTLMALRPGVTTMAYPVGAIGSMLLDILNGRERKQKIAYEIVERETVGSL